MSMAVPPLKALKHLMLCHDEYDDATSAAIGELRLLQTLRLSGRYGMADVIVCAPLELTGLLHLEEVAISNMVVRGGHVTLPSGCSLHVEGDRPEISSLYWETNARKGQLETLEFRDWVSRTEMPPFVSWSGCTYLFWELCKVGRLSMPVVFAGPGFQNLRQLFMQGTVISIHLPPELQLEVLHICAVKVMFACTDAHALAQGLSEVSFVYRLLSGHGVPELAVELGKLGKQMTPVPADFFPEEPDDEGQEHRLPWYGMYWRELYIANDVWPCTCGACETCL